MAIKRNEIELIKGGIVAGKAARSQWVQNMWAPEGTDCLAVRPGFGQIGQFDTGMSADLGLGSTVIKSTPGFSRHLGSKLFTTDNGTQQTVSVFWGAAYGDHQKKHARFMLFAHIHDLDTGASWSEPLYRHTSQLDEVSDALQGDTGIGSLAWFTAHQETNRDADYRQFYSYDQLPVFFTVMYDANKSTCVFFGSEQMGIWAYYPSELRTQDWDQGHRAYLQTLFTRDVHSGAAESGVIRPVTSADGPFSDAYTYRSGSDFPTAKAATTLGSTLVVADDTTLYFSDPGYPGSFIGRNIQEVPVKTPITGLGALGDNLVIFTDSETFFYAPSAGSLKGGGRLVKVHDEVGCINNNAITSMGSQLFWVDKSGIYFTSNGLNIEEASKEIRGFFKEGITNPLNNFYQSSGATSLIANQPRTTIKFDETDLVSLCYHETTGALLFSVPSANLIWCQTRGWSAWTTESIVKAESGVSEVGVTQNLDNPWVMTSKQGIYILCGPELQTVTDTLTIGASGAPAANHTKLSSFSLQKLGHGGALDRSVDISEDKRHLPGQYGCTTRWAEISAYFVSGFPGGPTGYGTVSEFGVAIGDEVYINSGEPIFDGPQTVTNVGPLNFQTNRDTSSHIGPVPTSGVAQGLKTYCPGAYSYVRLPQPEFVFTEGATRKYRLTFEYIPSDDTSLAEDITIDIAFDKSKWAPEATGSNISFELPSERLEDAALYTVELRDIAGVADPAGNVIHIEYSGSGTGANLNLAPRAANRLVSIYMTQIDPSLPVSGYGFTVKGLGIPVQWNDPAGGPTIELSDLIVWDPYLVERHQADNVAQSVDWAYKSDQVGLDLPGQVRARGTYAIMKSHGQPESANLLSPGWLYGGYNTLLGSDWKGWSTQVVDTDADLSVVQDKTTIRARIRSTNNVMSNKIFGAARYGNVMDITGLVPAAVSVLTVGTTHGLVTGDRVTIEGSAAPPINGTFVVTDTPAPTTFEIAVDSTGQPAIPGGTAVLTDAYLIDDEELDEIAVSDSVKGSSISYMAFGFMRDIAMALKIPSIKAIVEAAGSRRRRGR